jgi:hypothetical protein
MSRTTRTRRVDLVVLVALAALLVPFAGGVPTAQAEAPPHTSAEVFRIQGAGNPWQVKQAARDYSRRVPGLTVRIGGRCRPGETCIVARELNLGHNGTYGDIRGWTDGSRFDIRFNRYYRTARHGFQAAKQRNTACHELGHAFGLDHHDGRSGCMSSSARPDRASPAEIRTLRATYRP